MELFATYWILSLLTGLSRPNLFVFGACFLYYFDTAKRGTRVSTLGESAWERRRAIPFELWWRCEHTIARKPLGLCKSEEHLRLMGASVISCY